LSFIVAGMNPATTPARPSGDLVNSIYKSTECYYMPKYVFLIVSSLSNSSAVPSAMMCPLDTT